MYVLKTLSFCVLFSLIISGSSNVFNQIFITWRSEEHPDLNDSTYEERVRNLGDVVSKNATAWGRFTAKIDVGAGKMPLLKQDSITDIKNLTAIKMQLCNIANIEPGAFRNLPQLENLTLSFNRLVEIKSDTFANLSITYLDVGFNQISVLQPGAFRGLPNLKILRLELNSLEKFPRGLFDEPSNIRQLNLQKNDLSQIEREAFKDLPHLTDLDLGHNKLTEVQCSIFNFDKLQKLNLWHNSISSLPSDCFKNLPQLRKLNLSSNKVLAIPEGLFHYSKIEDLDLTDNEISVITSNAFDIPTLEILTLDSNNLTVWNNRWLRFTPKLQKLWVQENQIEELPDEALNYCSYISFGENRIKTISRNAFLNLKVIQLLDLALNQIENWDVGLLNNISVHYMSLYGNKLQCVDGDLKKAFGGAKQVILEENPWRPECQSKIDEFNVTRRSDTEYYSFFRNAFEN